MSYFPIYNVHSHWQQLVIRCSLDVRKEFSRNNWVNQGVANELYICSIKKKKKEREKKRKSSRNLLDFLFLKKIISVYIQVTKLFSIAEKKRERERKRENELFK
jgi:hypothetical protein